MLDSTAYIRKLTILLLVSGSINIVLMAFFFYWSIKERPPSPYFELKPASLAEQLPSIAVDSSDSSVIRYFRRMPMEWLISRLNNTQLVENGYTQRDLSLASLVTFHYFDLEKALSSVNGGQSVNLQKRIIRYGKFRDGTYADLTVYPALSEKHFEAVLKFTATEKWPLTTKGLFLALQKEDKNARDVSLSDAMMMTFEFNLVEMLFHRNTVPVERDELLGMILDGDWSEFSGFVEHQKASQDLSAPKRQAFLLKYIQNKSKSAAMLLLKTDEMFAAKKLDDSQVLEILKLLNENNIEAEKFALALLTSPRSDEVLKQAAFRLYQYAGEAAPEKDVVNAGIAKFAPSNFSNLSCREETIASAACPKKLSSIDPAKDKAKNSSINIPNSSSSKSVSKSNSSSLNSASSSSSKTIAEKLPPQLQKPQTLPLPKGKILETNLRQKTTPVAISAPHPKNRAKILPLPRENRYYVVQEGDSLWKISRKFNVEVEVIKAFNQLDTDTLRPGFTLRLPK